LLKYAGVNEMTMHILCKIRYLQKKGNSLG